MSPEIKDFRKRKEWGRRDSLTDVPSIAAWRQYLNADLRLTSGKVLSSLDAQLSNAGGPYLLISFGNI